MAGDGPERSYRASRSLLTTPWLADAIARLANHAPGPRISPAVSFAEIPAHTQPVSIPTRHGELTAVAYWPELAPTPPPVYLNFHGGGFVLRHFEQDDPLCRYLAANAGVVVVNIDYDVAPRHRFPDAVEEAYDAALWASRPERPWDGTRICVGGQSAGGALAAGAARLALEHGAPGIALQVLHYPPLDLATPGREKHAAGRSIISVPMTEVFDTAYAPTLAAKTSPLASPAWGSNAEGIEGIAPAIVVSCEYDRLHDEQVRYAHALTAAGALRAHLDLEGQDHGYNLLGADRDVVKHSYAFIAQHVLAATAGTS